MRITREIQFDTGHRIPNHTSQCANIHGHRYRVVAVLEGDLVRTPDVGERAMVMDFADVKRILMEHIHDPLDHGFLVWTGDTELREFLDRQGFKSVAMDEPPTAEALAMWCFRRVRDKFRTTYGNAVRLVSITVWETPSCSATYDEEDAGGGAA